MRRLLWILLLAAWCAFLPPTFVYAQGAKDNGYIYRTMPTASTIALFPNQSRIVVDGHSVISAIGCPEDGELVCLKGGGHSFVFPKYSDSRTQTWRHDGQSFAIVRQGKQTILGHSYDVVIIETSEGRDRYWYALSRQRGLLAFGQSEPQRSTFLLEGRCGFASPKECR